MENIPSKGAAILVSNHPSMLDAPVLAVVIKRKFYPFAKREVFNTKLKRWFLKRMGGIPVKAGKFTRAFVIETEKQLNDNNLLLIFPEGEINTNNKLEEFNFGFVKLAKRYNVPIIPITIKGTEKSVSLNHRFPKPADVTVTIFPPIKPVEGKLNLEEIKMKAEKIREEIQTN